MQVRNLAHLSLTFGINGIIHNTNTHSIHREQPSALAAVVPHFDGGGWVAISSGVAAKRDLLMGNSPGVVMVPNLALPRALEETLTVTQVRSNS